MQTDQMKWSFFKLQECIGFVLNPQLIENGTFFLLARLYGAVVINADLSLMLLHLFFYSIISFYSLMNATKSNINLLSVFVFAWILLLLAIFVSLSHSYSFCLALSLFVLFIFAVLQKICVVDCAQRVN